MSWILGFAGASLSPERRERLAIFGGIPILPDGDESRYIAAGGLPETCRSGTFSDGGRWVAIGTAIRRSDQACTIFDEEEWRRLLSSMQPNLADLGGGFIALREKGNAIEVYSDVLGVRSFYWTRAADGVLFSTKPDWLAALQGGATVDYSAFGSHWLAFNQIGYRGLLSGIERLPPAGCVRISGDTVRASSSAWTPGPGTSDPGTLLRSFLAPHHERTMSLGLSGGVDSRTLLALRPRNASFSTHTFGPIARPDVRVAMALARTANVPIRHFDLSPDDAALDGITRQAVAAQAVSPVSAASYLRFYRELHAGDCLVVDGGFGEILRRQFMNRLLRSGREALLRRDAAAVLPFIRFDRGRFFHPEVYRQMQEGAIDDLQAALDALPATLSPEDTVDLLAVRSRLPNFFGFEQGRLDADVLSYMPFAQPDVLNSVFSLPADSRRNGQIARGIISANDRLLKRHPLVKSATAYPYWMPASMATPYVLLRKRLMPPSETESAFVLRALREPLLDRIHSDEVRTCTAYEYQLLRKTVEVFFTGRRSHASDIDWWLAFDLWRQTVERGSVLA